MTTSYFPGHMAKARRQLKELLPLIDAGIVLLDARAPRASLGVDFNELLGRRPLIYALNKADLADPKTTNAWLAYLGTAVIIEARGGQGVNHLLDICLTHGRRQTKVKRPVRLVIMGIPNVGKSSLLNRLAGRRAMAVGDKPGITRARQWVKVRPDLEILDTPGLLAPRLADPQAAVILSLIAAIKDEIFSREILAKELISLLAVRYPACLPQRYGITPTGDPELDLENIGRGRGFLLPGGRVDPERAAAGILTDLRAGRLGRITLEDPT